jgi:hypothetical protein
MAAKARHMAAWRSGEPSVDRARRVVEVTSRPLRFVIL